MNALEMNNVTKRFGDFEAVRNLSFTIPGGTVYGLLGPNGAGKTTSIRMAMNIIIPDEGTIRVLGKNATDGAKADIGYLPEDRGLYTKMKVGEQIIFLAEIKGMNRSSARKEMDRWLKRFELEPWRDKKVEELSKGMQQKIQFIITIIHGPDLIILDEPFSGLDPVNTKLIKDIMLEIRDEGKTVVFSTHRMEQVEMICDNICLINKAQLVLEGNLKEIKKRYGKNSVFLEYEGDGRFIKTLPGIDKIDDYGRSMEIKLKDQADPQALLQKLVGRIGITKFELQEPSLNAIFIENVGADHAKDIHRH